MKIKKQHKLLSLVFSFALVVSALGAVVSASAEGESIAPVTKYENLLSYFNTTELEAKAGNGGNNFKDQFCMVDFVENAEVSSVNSNFSSWCSERWFDANTAAESQATLAPEEGATIDADQTYGQTNNYWRFRLKINGVLNNPTSFVFYSHRTYKSVSKHYEVFVSENANGANAFKIVSINDNTDRCGDFVDISSLSLQNIRYVEVRIYNTYGTNWNQCITEIGLFGGTFVKDNFITENTKFTTMDAANTKIAECGTNRIAGQSYEDSYFYTNSTKDELVSSDDLAGYNFSDGKIGTSSSSSASKGVGKWSTDNGTSIKASNDIFQTDTYREININFNTPVSNPQSFIFAFHEGGKMPSKHYAVYMSNNRDTLYDDSNKVIEITDTNERVADFIDISGANLNVVSWIGIRIYSFGYTVNGKGCKIQHISEIGLYGGMIAGDVNGSETVDNEDITALRTYLLTGTAETGYVYDVNGDEKENICDLVYVNSFIK